MKSTRARSALSKPIPPIVIRIVAAILLGLVTTVGGTWLLAYLVDGSDAGRMRWHRGHSLVATQIAPTPPNHPQQTGTHLTQVLRWRGWTTDIVEVWPVWSEDSNEKPYGSTNDLLKGTSFDASMKERLSRNESPAAWWRADGWPLRALSTEAHWVSYDALGTWPVVGGILLGSTRVFPDDGPCILPLQPIWSGLLFNFVFYTLLWFGIFSIGSIRGLIRRHRGLCVRCGYKLTPEQERCSECGEPVKRSQPLTLGR